MFCPPKPKTTFHLTELDFVLARNSITLLLSIPFHPFHLCPERLRPARQERGEDRRAPRAVEEAELERDARRRQADAAAPQGRELRPGEGRRGDQGVPRLQTEHARE